MQSRAVALGVLATFLVLALAGCTTPTTSPPGTTPPGTTPPGTGGTKLHCSGAAMANFTADAADPADAPGAPAAAPGLAGVAPLPGPDAAQREQVGTTADELVIGTMLPLTGALEAYGPDMEKATDLAVKEINDAGGVNGKPVRILHENDRSTETTVAPQTFQKLVAERVDAVVGGAASSITGAILEGAIASKVVVVTPASTSPVLTLERDNQGFFVRIPPSDALQGKVLAQVVYADGCRSASILAVNNPYGVGLGTVFQQTFEALGGQVKSTTRFDENAQSFGTEVQRSGGDKSDAIVLIGYPGQASPIMKEAFQRGFMQSSVFFFSEGVKDPKFVTDAGKDTGGKFILAGLRGTAPGSVTSPGFAHFNTTFSAQHGNVPGLFAAESYDAVWMIALAAQCGGTGTGEAIKANILKVGNRDLAADVPAQGGQAAVGLNAAKMPGCGINYQGAAHDFDFDAKGDPKEGVYTVWEVQADGSLKTVRENVRPA